MSYESATPIAGSPTFTRGVKAKWERSPPTVWLGVPIHFARYDPPSNTNQTLDVRGRTRTVARWEDSEWSDFKRDFIRTINEFWHHRFVLVPASRTSRGMPPDMPGALICGYKAWAEPNPEWATMKPLVFKPATEGGWQRSECQFFGRPISSGLPLNAPRGITSVLDKSDLEPRTIHTPIHTSPVPVISEQRGATHESGHHIGLMHRCIRVSVRDVPSFRSFNVDMYDGDNSSLEGTYVHEQARATSRGGNGYCVASNDKVAIQDLMARGESCHPWHAAPWVHIIQSAANSPDADSFLQTVGRVTWTPIVRHG